MNTGTLDVLYENVVQLVMKKNSDYGDAWQTIGTLTPAVRLIDKAKRLATIESRGSISTTESIRETVVDIVGYCMLALLYKKHNDGKKHGVYGLPTVLVTENALRSLKHSILNDRTFSANVAAAPVMRSTTMLSLAESLLYAEYVDNTLWVGESDTFMHNVTVMAKLALHMLYYLGGIDGSKM